MSLIEVQKNKTAVIISFKVENKNLLKRLYDIGLRMNGKITVLKNAKNTCFLVEVGGRAIAISRELASLIFVKVEDEVF
ncbi:MAG: ferrous iron transport protein A [Clostridia bacterium]|nr:ferrous iron transport protein A [Clostridia bacterium]